MKKYKYSVIITILLVIALPICAFAKNSKIPKPTKNFFINDFADVISADDEEIIQKIGADLYSQTTAQVVVVTVNTVDGEAVNDYALELGNEWGVGSKEKDNGVVLLLAVSERKVTIQVGYGLEGCLPDGKTGRILDKYAIPYLSDNDFSTGLTETYKAITAAVYDEYGVQQGAEYYDSSKYEVLESDAERIAEIIITIIIIIVILLLSFTRRRRRWFFGPFVGRPDSFGGGGGFRGGGGFSGGGGSFGGGGSSRGF